MKYDGLEEKLNIQTEIIEPLRAVSKAPVGDDHEHARETLYGLIEKGNEAIAGILNVATHSEHPRSYEVAGQLIKTVSEVAKTLMEVQKIRKDVEKQDPAKIKTQNNLFVGSTHELMKMMKAPLPPIETADITAVE